jgi:alkyldihydroxyacetonephosphate synthase
MTRSWWGWGNVEDAVSPDERKALVRQVQTLLPNADLTLHQAPPLLSLRVRPPRVSAPSALAHLASTELADRVRHSHGQAYRDVVRCLMGRVDHVVDAVLRPTAENEVADVLDWCTGERIAVIPFGGGSSVVGGVEPRFDGDYAGVVALDLTAMNRVLEIDRVSRAARIQAGVLGPALEDQLRGDGYSLRHFPQSFEFSTLGGWLATRSGGHFATLYTHIDDLTESLRVVTPRGISESRRLPGSGAGPSPDRMFLGSEGTLGVITEAWMRLQERPRWRAGASVIFDDYAQAVDATRTVAQSGLFPSNCRLLDPTEAMLNAGTTTAGGVLVLAFESADHPVDGWLARAVEIVADYGGTLPDGVRSSDSADVNPTSGAADTWRSSFIRMPYRRDALAQHSMITETFETSCTWDTFDTLHAAVTEVATAAMATVDAPGVLTCRFTHVYPDGPAPYFGVYAAGHWGKTLGQWDDIKAAVSQVLVDHGASITHHHAIGRDHRGWYDRQRPEPFVDVLRAAKDVLDPAGILNPGVLIDPADGRSPA